MPARTPLTGVTARAAAVEQPDGAWVRERSQTLCLLYALGGTVALGTVAVGAWPPSDVPAIAAVGVLAFAVCLLIRWRARHLSLTAASVLVALGTLLVATAQLATGTVAAAATASIVYVYCLLYAVLFLRTVDIVVQVALIVAAQTFVLTTLGSNAPVAGRGLAAHIMVNVAASIGIAVVLAQQLRRRRAAERAASEQLRVDATTGLANRQALLEHAHDAMHTPAVAVALLLLDLDAFRDVNDTFGVEVGDQLLHAIGQRLQPVADGEGVLARVGGDEFAMLLTTSVTANLRQAAQQAAERLQAALHEPFEIDGVALSIEARVGVALAVLGSSAEDLLRQAVVAAERARGNPRAIDTVAHVPPRRSPDHLALLAEVRRTLEDGDAAGGAFVPYFQPLIDLTRGTLVGAEALVRWRHPVRGLVAPGDFLPLVERTTLMRRLTAHVLGAALQACAGWHRAHLPLTVAVNVSARDLADPALPDIVAGELARAALPGAALVVEITETALMGDLVQVTDTMTQLRALGVGVAVDDFGTGWSSLVHLQRLPVTELKIDRSFVSGARSDDDAAKIAAATIGLGQSLGLAVVAEGIEDAETVTWLATLGCHKGQGFYFGRPMPAADFIALARDASWRTATAQAAGARQPAQRAGTHHPAAQHGDARRPAAPGDARSTAPAGAAPPPVTAPRAARE